MIAPTTSLGAVHLTVSDLERSLDYYGREIGLTELERGAGRASLGAGDTELLVLREEPGARPADGYTGLFHLALLVPDRASLARWLAHAARDRVALTGLSDHDVSEALYLRDPDHHGIEIYADRPRELWDGQVGARLTTVPLRLRSSPPGAITTTSARTPGRARARRRRPRAPHGCSTRRWCCPTSSSGPVCSRGSSRRTTPRARSCAIRPGTHSC
jgi:catechol-2,3-dioxygenase